MHAVFIDWETWNMYFKIIILLAVNIKVIFYFSHLPLFCPLPRIYWLWKLEVGWSYCHGEKVSSKNKHATFDFRKRKNIDLIKRTKETLSDIQASVVIFQTMRWMVVLYKILSHRPPCPGGLININVR